MKRPNARPRRIATAVVGLGALWDDRYRDPLARLQNRIDLQVVYDPVFGRTQHVAQELRIRAANSLRGLFEHPGLQTVLVLDAGWLGAVPLRLAVEQKLPLFLAGRFELPSQEVERWHTQARADGTTVMAEFSRRHTPATCRLLELMATRIGRPERILVRVPAAETHLTISDTGAGYIGGLIGLLDWCTYVVGRPPARLSAEPRGSFDPASLAMAQGGWCQPGEGDPARVECVVELEFPKSGSSGAVSATLLLESDHAVTGLTARPPARTTDDIPSVVAEHWIRCSGGEALIQSHSRVNWMSAGGQFEETLAEERSAEERMLDLFFRRAVGGLVPVPDLSDVRRALEMAATVQVARHEQRAIQREIV